MPAIGAHVIAAGVLAALAFVLWWPLGLFAVAALLNAARVALWPPFVVRVDHSGVRLGGRMTVVPVRVVWTAIEDVSLDKGHLIIDREEAESIAFPLAYVGVRAGELVREVYERLNSAHGYRRFNPAD